MTKDELKQKFTRIAEWRRQKAAEHPDDHRDAQAAMVLDRLASSVDEIKDHDFEAYNELLEGNTELQADLLMGVGFGWWPKSAEEFIETYIANRKSHR